MFVYNTFGIEMDNTFGMEMDKMGVCLGNGLHCFKPFGIEMSNTVHHF